MCLHNRLAHVHPFEPVSKADEEFITEPKRVQLSVPRSELPLPLPEPDRARFDKLKGHSQSLRCSVPMFPSGAVSPLPAPSFAARVRHQWRIWFEFPAELVAPLAPQPVPCTRIKTPSQYARPAQRPQGAKQGSGGEGHEPEGTSRSIPLFALAQSSHGSLRAGGVALRGVSGLFPTTQL